MATTASYFDHKSSSTIRPGLSHLQHDPSSPRTPQRQISSAFSSPSVSYRAEEEAIVFELGNRYLSSGYAGEDYPRCKLRFGPDESRRVGDYRKWLPRYNDRKRKRRRLSTWGNESELWRMDIRDFDLGIVKDKVVRAVREAYNKYLLLDSKARKVYLIVPSVVPHQLLSRIIHTLFDNFQMPNIMLLSPPILAAVAAGCRYGLVVDIGWRETIITAVYDYREVCQHRTVRGMRLVTSNVARILERYKRQAGPHAATEKADGGSGAEIASVSVDLEQAEEVTARMAWCRQRSTRSPEEPSLDTTSDVTPGPTASESPLGKEPQISSTDKDSEISSVPSPFSARHSLDIPFSEFADAVENALFTRPGSPANPDDHEQSLPRLIYQALISLPPDVRSLCMSRIMITGGGSHILGLKPCIIDEVALMVKERGWDPVCGRAADERRRRVQEMSTARKAENQPTSDGQDTPTAVPASLAPTVHADIDERLRQDQEQYAKPTVSGVVRGVETLGAWAGGSLLASLRIKGIVEIEKDTFLQSGLAGAKRDGEVSALSQQKSYGADMSRAGIGERTSWTLGAWA